MSWLILSLGAILLMVRLVTVTRRLSWLSRLIVIVSVGSVIQLIWTFVVQPQQWDLLSALAGLILVAVVLIIWFDRERLSSGTDWQSRLPAYIIDGLSFMAPYYVGLVLGLQLSAEWHLLWQLLVIVVLMGGLYVLRARVNLIQIPFAVVIGLFVLVGLVQTRFDVVRYLNTGTYYHGTEYNNYLIYDTAYDDIHLSTPLVYHRMILAGEQELIANNPQAVVLLDDSFLVISKYCVVHLYEPNGVGQRVEIPEEDRNCQVMIDGETAYIAFELVTYKISRLNVTVSDVVIPPEYELPMADCISSVDRLGLFQLIDRQNQRVLMVVGDAQTCINTSQNKYVTLNDEYPPMLQWYEEGSLSLNTMVLIVLRPYWIVLLAGIVLLKHPLDSMVERE